MRNKIIRMSTSKSVIINVEFFFPFGNKTLLEEVRKTTGAGALESYE